MIQKVRYDPISLVRAIELLYSFEEEKNFLKVRKIDDEGYVYEYIEAVKSVRGYVHITKKARIGWTRYEGKAVLKLYYIAKAMYAIFLESAGPHVVEKWYLDEEMGLQKSPIDIYKLIHDVLKFDYIKEDGTVWRPARI
jgi:hypothetical protein